MKNKTIFIILILIIIASFLINITYSKYTSQLSSSDTAEVAKWGIKVTSKNNIYKNSYVKGDNTLVLSTNKVLSPGIIDNNSLEFTVSGKSDVTTRITYEMKGSSIYLKSGIYKDVTTNKDNTNFIIDDDYMPVKYTLTKNSEPLAVGTLNEVIKVFNKNEDISKGTIKNDVYKLTWEWVGTNDKADTFLSNLVLESGNTNKENYNINESVTININLVQVD